MSSEKEQKKGSLVTSSKREIEKYSSALINRGLELAKVIERKEKCDLFIVNYKESIPFCNEEDSLETYLMKINQFPVLTQEEEFQLAVRYRKNNDDIDAAHKLITSNLRFVVKVALGYRSYGFKLVDLIQEGNIGLMMAVKKFNPYKGYRFISYAIWWIRAYIQNFIIKRLETGKIRKRTVLNAMKPLNEQEIYVIKNRIMANPPVTLQKIGNHLKLSKEKVRQIERKNLKKLKKDFGERDGVLTKLITAIRNTPD